MLKKLKWYNRYQKRINCEHNYKWIYCYHTGLAMYKKCEKCNKKQGSIFFNLI